MKEEPENNKTRQEFKEKTEHPVPAFLCKSKEAVINRPECERKKFSGADKHLQIPVGKIHRQIADKRVNSEIRNKLIQRHSRKNLFRTAVPVYGAADAYLNKKINRSHEQRYH